MFGNIIEATGEPFFQIKNGMANRFHALAHVPVDEQGETVISIVDRYRYPLPHRIEVVERHPLGSQAFIPCDSSPFVVVVAPPDDPLERGRIRAFMTNGKQGVNYHAGVWHGLLLTPYAEMCFLCVDREGPGSNCEERHFSDDEQYVLDIE